MPYKLKQFSRIYAFMVYLGCMRVELLAALWIMPSSSRLFFFSFFFSCCVGRV